MLHSVPQYLLFFAVPLSLEMSRNVTLPPPHLQAADEAERAAERVRAAERTRAAEQAAAEEAARKEVRRYAVHDTARTETGIVGLSYCKTGIVNRKGCPKRGIARYFPEKIFCQDYPERDMADLKEVQ